MHQLNIAEQRALGRLPNNAARIIAQRWLELTDDHTHPEWRWRGYDQSYPEESASLLDSFVNDDEDPALNSVELVASHMLSLGGTRQWQSNSVRTFLLDVGSRFSTSELDFKARLERFTGLAVSEQSNYAEAVEANVDIYWKMEPIFPKSARVPWENPRLELEREDYMRPIKIQGRSDEEGRKLALHIRLLGDEPRKIGSAASHLRAEGTLLLDLLRLAFPEKGFQLRPAMEVAHSERITHFEPLTFPRLQSSRAQMALASLLSLYNSSPTSDPVRRVVNAARWLSTAVNRWPENPRSAAALLWMALENFVRKVHFWPSSKGMSGKSRFRDRSLYKELEGEVGIRSRAVPPGSPR